MATVPPTPRQQALRTNRSHLAHLTPGNVRQQGRYKWYLSSHLSFDLSDPMAFTLPDLPYDYDALEPHIDEKTMRIHHTKHHQGYTNKLNNALDGSGREDASIEDLLGNLEALPESTRTAVRNNGGGFYNHGIFWTVMSPNGGGSPTGELGGAIEAAFGSYEAFKEAFKDTASGVFGSGWAWLAVTPNGDLRLHGLSNQDNPIMHGDRPILGIDVWEHAYYLNYQNKRGDYIDHWFEVINWDEADRRYREAKEPAGSAAA